MKPKRYPTNPEDIAFYEAFLSDDPNAIDNFFRAHGIEPGLGDPVDLRSIPREEWQPLTKVFPTPGMQRYLDSEDDLTDHTIEMMEDALTAFYQVEHPWFLCAECTGQEKLGNLAVSYFYIDRETPRKGR